MFSSVDPSFRYDLKYTAANAFETVNPRIFMHACIDPAAMEKIAASDQRIEQEKAEYAKAVKASQGHRIASESLAIFEERMRVNQTPKPPSWADDGRGGPFDPRTIYEQARQRINLKDQSYHQQLEDFKTARREDIAMSTHEENNTENASQAANLFEQMKADLLEYVDQSHETRTDLNVWYKRNQDALIERQLSQGADDPTRAAQEEQRERVSATVLDTKSLISKRIDELVHAFNQTYQNDNAIRQQEAPEYANDPIPEPPRLRGVQEQSNGQSQEQGLPEISHKFSLDDGREH